MGIYNIGYGGFDSFRNDYRINNIPKAEDIITKPIEQVEEKPKQESISITPVDNRPLATDPNNVSLTFNKGDDFSYIGSQKDTSYLDMRKAISDMQQDSILQEYNYFVGNGNKLFNSEDGTVIMK